jgi:hypothetical protein
MVLGGVAVVVGCRCGASRSVLVGCVAAVVVAGVVVGRWKECWGFRAEPGARFTIAVEGRMIGASGWLGVGCGGERCV